MKDRHVYNEHIYINIDPLSRLHELIDMFFKNSIREREACRSSTKKRLAKHSRLISKRMHSVFSKYNREAKLGWSTWTIGLREDIGSTSVRYNEGRYIVTKKD